MRIGRIATLLTLPLLFAACTVHEVREEYPPGVDFPAAYSIKGEAEPSPDPWWEALGDPRLSRAIGRVIEGNPGLMQSWARLRQAEAMARQAESFLYPEVGVRAGASRSRTNIALGGEAGERDVTSSLFNLSVGVSYEVDLWKRLENRRDAADTLALASREDLDALAMTLASRVAEVWYSIAEQKAQIDLLGEQERIGRTFLELLELRFSLGQATALDVYQQRQQLAATRAQFPLAESLLGVLRNQLAVLMGLAPGGLEDEPGGLLPELPALPDPGLPAELLQRRPDVRGAQLRILAADHGVGEAVADLLPALRLSGEAGFQGRAVEETFSNMIYQLVAGLAGPVYDRGRRQAEVERRKEVLEERLQGYRQKVLEALQEVEDALVREDRQGAYLLEVGKQIDLSRSTLKQAGFRYSNGQSDYLPVLTALQGLQRLERSEISSRRQLISQRIQLYRALGGAWTDNLHHPESQSKVISNGERP